MNATASSTKLPLEMNSLNSFRKFFTAAASSVGEYRRRPLKHVLRRHSCMWIARTTLRQ
jgi:hypothetical protein